MTAFNVVRFKVKPGMAEAFLGAHRDIAQSWSGLRHANIIEAGEGRYCIIAEWGAWKHSRRAGRRWSPRLTAFVRRSRTSEEGSA